MRKLKMLPLVLHNRFSITYCSEIRQNTELEDNMLTDRYAKVTTNNGQEINSDDSTSTGYGIWRLIRPDIEYIVQYASGGSTYSDR